MELSEQTKNYAGKERKVGLEIEYAGLPLDNAASIIHQLFGGTIDKVTDAVFKVKDTELGNFTLELDAIPLQKIATNAEKLEKKAEERLVDGISLHVGKVIRGAGTKIVPFEIISPPVTLSKLSKLEALRKELLKAGANDTRKNLYTAFGLHINPEVTSLDVGYIVHHLQSFLLLAPWLKQLHNIDFTRRITSFIDPFPKSYLELVLNKEYAPNIEQLIYDYYKHNPTRNRMLDMLPLFAYLDEFLVRRLYGKKEKINKRPTFHYRMPNCELANAEWSFNTEWKRWLHVEELASNRELLHKLIEQWQAHQKHWFSFEYRWLEKIKKTMEE